KGYRILAHDLRSPVGEIDIVAQRGRTLAIIEVKARDTVDSAVEAVTLRQRARIVRAAERFLAGRPQFAGYAVRFDVIMVTPGRWPRHLSDAWRPDGDTAAAKC
ncbi:MAG: YraN family protein, partial [Dongiaceae bacterium]